MKELFDSYKNSGTIHHAYVIEGEGNSIRESLFPFFEKELKHRTQGNPDFWHSIYDVFGIDEARSLRELQGNRAFGGDRKIFVIEANSLTHEAQNSLLKVFEEPTEGTHFFLLMPSADRLLPTLRSRVLILKNSLDMSRPRGRDMSKTASFFLKMNQAERADFIKPLIEDKQKAIQFVNELEREVRNSLDLTKATKKEIFNLEQIEKVRNYLPDRSSSVKQLLEYLSVII